MSGVPGLCQGDEPGNADITDHDPKFDNSTHVSFSSLLGT